MKTTLSAYIELTKPRITLLVLVTAYLGYYLGLRSQGSHMATVDSWLILFYLILGTWATSAGAAVLNQVIERRHDAKMTRTKNRPLVIGRIGPMNALVFGMVLSFSGYVFLYYLINPLTAWISAATVFLYILIYTPSKRITTWNTIIGSIPGALPPVGGWVAATGSLAPPAWILFGILFCWQMPHFLAIAIIYAADYEKGGFKMLPNTTDNVDEVSFQIIFFVPLYAFSTAESITFLLTGQISIPIPSPSIKGIIGLSPTTNFRSTIFILSPCIKNLFFIKEKQL